MKVSGCFLDGGFRLGCGADGLELGFFLEGGGFWRILLLCFELEVDDACSAQPKGSCGL